MLYMESLNHVKLKRILLSSDLEKQISSAVDVRIKSLPNFTELRVNPELILLVCNLIENGTTQSKIKLLNVADALQCYGLYSPDG